MTSKTTPSKTSTITEAITDLTQVEAIESLTGYDELAIKQKFGAPIGALFDESISTARRALVFAIYSRQDNGPKDAYKAAMNLTVGDLDRVFGEDEPEVMDDEPVTESGKDGSQPA